MHDRATEAPASKPPMSALPPTAAESRLIAARPGTPAMDELFAFLAARYDEAERDYQSVHLSDCGCVLDRSAGSCDCGYPDRVLRDVAAKRAILDWLGHQDRVYGDYSVIETLELVVRHLGAEFSDHPDYREEWKP